VTVRWMTLSRDLGMCNGRPGIGVCWLGGVGQIGEVDESGSRSMVIGPSRSGRGDVVDSLWVILWVGAFITGSGWPGMGALEVTIPGGVGVEIAIGIMGTFITGVQEDRWPGMGVIVTSWSRDGLGVTEVGTAMEVFVTGVHKGRWLSWPGMEV